MSVRGVCRQSTKVSECLTSDRQVRCVTGGRGVCLSVCLSVGQSVSQSVSQSVRLSQSDDERGEREQGLYQRSGPGAGFFLKRVPGEEKN